MIQGFLSQIGRLHKNLKIIKDFALSGKILKSYRPEGPFDIELLLGKMICGWIEVFIHTKQR